MTEYLTLTVHEFRKNMKAALDTALEGNIVIIDRMGQRFSLTHLPRGIEIAMGTTPAKKISLEPTALKTIPPRIKDGDTPVRTDDEWEEVEAAELACCKKTTPCKHWEYNPLTNIWKNSISGRQREVTE